MAYVAIYILLLITLLIVFTEQDDLFLKKKKKATTAAPATSSVSTAVPYPYSSTTEEDDNSANYQTSQPARKRGRGPYRYRKGTTLYYMASPEPNDGYDYSTSAPPKPAKKKTGSKPVAPSTTQQQQQQQQQEVVNCMNKNKMSNEMKIFKERAKMIENGINNNSIQLFNVDLTNNYQFLIYDFINLIEQLGKNLLVANKGKNI